MSISLIQKKKYLQATKLNPTSAELDNYIIAFAASANTTPETIDLTVGKYSKTYRTTASNAAMITLAGKNKMIIVNEHLSKEIVIEGDFSNGGAAWLTTGAGTVNTGVGVISGIGMIAQNFVLAEHLTFYYRVKYLISNRTNANDLQTANYSITWPSTNGQKEFLLNATAAGVSHNLEFRFDSGTAVINIDNVSFKMIGDKTFGAIGDSIMSSTLSHAYLLMRARKWALHNYAVAGQNIISNMASQVSNVGSINADTIIIELGTNDSEIVGEQAAIQAAAEAGIIALKAANPKATIYWMNVLPRWTDVGGGTPYARTVIRATIAAACAAQGITCWDTFTDPWIVASDTSDGVHPTAGGYAKIKTRIDALLP